MAGPANQRRYPDGVVIWHNPRCSKSRGVLALLRAAGIEPTVVDYQVTPPDADAIERALALLGMTARALLRSGEAAYTELGLDDPACTDAELIAAMAAHPSLI